MKKEQVEQAIQNSIPMKPIRIELGGDYYYRCHWVSCNADIKKWFSYCPQCGQKIKWENE